MNICICIGNHLTFVIECRILVTFYVVTIEWYQQGGDQETFLNDIARIMIDF